MLTVLSQVDVKQSITMLQAIDILEVAFKQLALGQTVLPLRTALPIDKKQAVTLTMPAFMQGQEALGVKIVSVFPENAAAKIPVINGVIVLLDAETGRAKALIEASYLTALRTGAVSGLATRYLAKENAKHLAVIGSGPQAVMQLEAVAAVRPIDTVSLWSRDYNKAMAFAKIIEDHYEVLCHREIKQAVKQAEVICTATPSTEPLIHLADINPEVHINAVGSHTPAMTEVSLEVMAKATVVVDQREAALAEAGEVIAAVKAKCLEVQQLIELGQLILSPPSLSHGLTVFKSVGLAIQDISIAQVVYENAVVQGRGLKM